MQSILDTGPGQTITALGKRHRSEEGDLSSALEMRGPAPRASQPVYQEHPPSKKRPRLAENARAGPSTVQTTDDADEDAVGEDDDFVEPVHIIPGPPFTVFSGQEEPPEIFNPPPPTTRLSDLFPIATPSALSNGGGTVTSTANAPENQIPPAGGLNSAFNFVYSTSDFQPMTSTPAGGHFEMGGPSFPFPEPPTSPTPGNGPTGGFIERGGRRERNDLFRPHGAPSRTPSRSSRPRSSASNRARSESQSRHSSAVPPHITSYEPPCISPAALMRTPILPAVPESEPEETPQPRRNPATILGMGIGVGMVGLPIQMPPDTPAPPLKRTMYGTELDADTRFGDFGVEGVAMGFWTGAAHRV